MSPPVWALSSFLNRHFEWPLVLILIPVTAIMIFAGRRRKVTAPSRIIFGLSVRSAGDRVFTLLSFLLPVFLIFVLLTLQIAAFAGPRSVAIKVTEKSSKGRIAVIVDDVSGSMTERNPPIDGPRRLDNEINANKAFLKEFCREENNKINDKVGVNYVGLVTFTDTASVIMSPTRDCNIIRRRLELLSPKGGTAIEKGLWQAASLIISMVDKKGLIPDSELQSIYASLHERTVRLPKHAKEFCNQYKGLSIELFTDGDFPSEYDTREKALQFTSGSEKASVRTINPFHVIDFAKSLCIRTYFWSVYGLNDSYKEAFAAPPGGFAVLIGDLNPGLITESYRDVARKEAGEMIREETETYNPLKTYFLLMAFVMAVIVMCLIWSKTFSRHSEGRKKP